MFLRTATLSLALALAVPGQSTYDDFSGASLDRAKWFQYSDYHKATQANGKLRMWGRGHYNEFGVLSLNGFEGDFEVTVEFKGFRAGGLEGSVALFVSDAEGIKTNERDMSVGIGRFRDSTGKVWVGFDGEMIANDKYVGGGSAASATKAGSLRVVRKGTSASLFHRAAGQTSFSQLGSTVPNFFVSNYAFFGIEMQMNNEDGVDVDIDRVTYTGKFVSNIKAYGNRCLGLDAIPLGYPRIGNTGFRMIVLGGPAFRFDPYQFTIGVQRTAIPLTASGAPGCALYTSPVVILAGKLDDEGEAGVGLPIPNNASLRGIVFQAQFVANTNRNSMGLAWSNGIECKIF